MFPKRNESPWLHRQDSKLEFYTNDPSDIIEMTSQRIDYNNPCFSCHLCL